MDAVSSLVKAIIRENPHELLLENWKALEFSIKALESDHPTKALEAVLYCTQQTGECPKNIASVISFIRENVHHNQDYEKTEGYELQLNEIEEEEDEAKVSAAVLVDTVYNKAYNQRYAQIHLTASKIATGAVKNPHTKETGPQAAKEFIYEEENHLYVVGPQYVHGDLRENIDYVETLVNSFILDTKDSKRLYTGFKHIDNLTLIGRRQPIRWIGILGYTSHGKSLLLNTMVYNMACLGANIMLCPLEQTLDYTYMTLVWLHYKKVCPDRKLIPLAEWQKLGQMVGHDVWKTVQMIIADLREGKTLKGKIVVESAETWSDVKDKLRLTNKKNKYDVLAVDYIGHLKPVGGKGESDQDKHNRDFADASELARIGIENDKTGLVVITPLQAGKKAWEEAAKQDGDNYGVYESPAAVDWYTKAAHDMDCLIGLWQDGDTCLAVSPKQMIVYCVKGRFNMKFPKFRLALNPESGLLYDIDSTDKALDPERTIADLSDKDMNSAYTTAVTTTIDPNNWSDKDGNI